MSNETKVNELDSFFSEENEVPSNWVKWGKQGDWIKGVFISVEEKNGKDFNGNPSREKVYEFRVHAGEYHNMDAKRNPVEPGIILGKGELYFVGGRKGIDAQMRNAKVGEVIGIKFIEEKPNADKMKAPSKTIKVYNPHEIDPEWLAEQEAGETQPDWMKDA